jgi:30S ribosomal protein S31
LKQCLAVDFQSELRVKACLNLKSFSNFEVSHKEEWFMGKGDQRSRRGKIHRGTFGRRRPKQNKKAIKPAVVATAMENPPKKASRKESVAAE